VFIRALQWSLSWVRWIYSVSYILILSSHLRLGLRSGLRHSGFQVKILYAFPFSLMKHTCHFTNTWLLQDVAPCWNHSATDWVPPSWFWPAILCTTNAVHAHVWQQTDHIDGKRFTVSLNISQDIEKNHFLGSDTVLSGKNLPRLHKNVLASS
jgi:hypothetical protein